MIPLWQTVSWGIAGPCRASLPEKERGPCRKRPFRRHPLPRPVLPQNQAEGKFPSHGPAERNRSRKISCFCQAGKSLPCRNMRAKDSPAAALFPAHAFLPLSLKEEPSLRNSASPPLPETPGTARSTTATAKNFNAQFPLHTGSPPPFPPPIRQRIQGFRFRRIFRHTGSYAEKHIDNKLFLMVMFYFSAHRYSAEGPFCPLPVRRKKKKR